MTRSVTKTPAEALDLALDWDELRPGETLAEDLGWTISPGESGPGALAIASASLQATRSLARLSGGRPGGVHHLSCRVRTCGGRVLVGAVLVRVAPE